LRNKSIKSNIILATIQRREDAFPLQNTTSGNRRWANFLFGRQHTNLECAWRAEHPICIYFRLAPPIRDVHDRTGKNHDFYKNKK